MVVVTVTVVVADFVAYIVVNIAVVHTLSSLVELYLSNSNQ